MTHETVKIEHNGMEFEVRKIDPKNPPVKVLRALEDGKGVGAAEALLGPVQFAKYVDTDPLADDLNELVSKIMGTDVGKSDS